MNTSVLLRRGAHYATGVVASHSLGQAIHIARAVSMLVAGSSQSSSSLGASITGMRLWIDSMSAFGAVVKIV
jgi:hypothetical protein